MPVTGCAMAGYGAAIFILLNFFSALVCGSVSGEHPAKPTIETSIMSKTEEKDLPQVHLEKRERAMVEGILEGSPDGIGVVVIRLDCGCRKMAAVAGDGEPASKVIMYRDNAESICEQCKDDQGAYIRVTEQFIYWKEPAPPVDRQKAISVKVLGTAPTSTATH